MEKEMGRKLMESFLLVAKPKTVVITAFGYTYVKMDDSIFSSAELFGMWYCLEIGEIRHYSTFSSIVQHCFEDYEEYRMFQQDIPF